MGEKQEGATGYLGRCSARWEMARDELSAVAVVEAAVGRSGAEVSRARGVRGAPWLAKARHGAVRARRHGSSSSASERRSRVRERRGRERGAAVPWTT